MVGQPGSSGSSGCKGSSSSSYSYCGISSGGGGISSKAAPAAAATATEPAAHLLEEVARLVLQQPPLLHDVVKELARLQRKTTCAAAQRFSKCAVAPMPTPSPHAFQQCQQQRWSQACTHTRFSEPQQASAGLLDCQQWQWAC